MPDRIPAYPFYFVRHGETDWNLQNRMQGKTDIPLNETGRAQATLAATTLADVAITTICASPLGRALETANIIRSTVDAPMDIISDLQEVGCGEKEGEPRGQWYTDWLDGRSTPIGGETPTAFLERILNGVGEALSKPGPVLIVSHGQVFRTLIHAIGAQLDEHTPNGVPMYLEPIRGGRGGWSLDLMRAA